MGIGASWRKERLARAEKNPLIVGTVSGLMVNLFGLEMPAPALKLLSRLGDGAIVLGLLTVGAGLRLNAFSAGQHGTAPAFTSRHVATMSWLLTVKLLAMPALAWWLGRQMELPPLYANIVLTFAALPTASSAFILAQRMGGDGSGVAWLISASTLLSLISLPIWLSLAV